ncbi:MULTISPECIES: sugar MFS transporter [unclassified Spirosoma]|uniref:sugar MFS transporter n=1 Tax=unclassified Spirosoma TaxID=2621999 RepID=UPI0009613FC1|nr:MULTISPECIES: sugar MFS transporter [unclassified Spirosoma]MBN8826669.1 sugar MFS transporter [Spirosoma sp.]OJW75035.1 MAG: MFS transporter [Spirosoma sp. 48-14]
MKRNTLLVILVLVIFFVISFLTNILGPIIPDLVDSFQLSIGLAGFLPFAFFVAYGVSIPAGILVETYREKTMLIGAFLLAFLGSLLFALVPQFSVALGSLFAIGVGMAVLQVAINPLLRVAGGEEHFAFNSVMAQLFSGAASFLSPLLYSYFVQTIHKGGDGSFWIQWLDKLVPTGVEWVSLYWVFALTTLLMIGVVALVRFPKVELKADEKVEVGGTLTALLRNRTVLLYFAGIFAYVGTEQGISNWISKFLQLYHGVDPATAGAQTVAYFWGLMTIGCVLGLILLKVADSRNVLRLFTLGAILSLLIGLFGPKEWALIALPGTGFFASVMWSIIFSLALNSVPEHHGTFSGILCTGIVGGALVPLIIGGLAEWVGLRLAMLVMLLTLGYIFSIGIWAKPLINNATIKRKSERVKE